MYFKNGKNMSKLSNLVKVTLIALSMSGSLSYAEEVDTRSVKEQLAAGGEASLMGMIRCASLAQYFENALPKTEKTKEMRDAMETMRSFYVTLLDAGFKGIEGVNMNEINNAIGSGAAVYKNQSQQEGGKEFLKLELKQCADYLGDACRKTGKCWWDKR
jgi:hypothetical protein